MGVGWKSALTVAGHRGGLFTATGALFGGRRLTVLAYHRVVDPHGTGFDTYRRNVSATPQEFGRHMDYVAEHFQPVSLAQVEGALIDGLRLPRRPLLLTFDDGYRDNLTNALPVARDRGIPMTVFLATGFIGSGRPFPWDLAAWCFAHTKRTRVDLPVIGEQSWATEQEREEVLGSWLEALKRRPEVEREAATAALPDCLGMTVPPGGFPDLCLSWAEVRAMAAEGVAFGAHTEQHPILTRVPGDRARREVRQSKRRIEEELGRPVTAFAYPNGGRADVNDGISRLLHEEGYRLAFTLLPGPDRIRAARRAPLNLRRAYIHHGDHVARFAAKVNGLPRLLGAAR